MIEIKFSYNQQIIVIQAKEEEKFQVAIDKYLQKAHLDPKDVYFLLNGGPVIPEEKVGKQISQFNRKEKNVEVLVELGLMEKTTTIKSVQSKDIICPQCIEPCQIKFENCKITLFDCINNHIKQLKIKEFFKSQKINISNIICGICNIKNKGNCPNNEFYKCLICNTNICLICKQNHQRNHHHRIINYNEKNYLCNIDNEPFIKYCSECKKNLCKNCNDMHENNHILFNKNMPNINEIKNNLNDMWKEIEIFNQNINDIINKLKDLTNIMKIYYDINNNILNNYQNKNVNYQILENINQIKNNEIYLKLNKINKMTKIKDKISSIIDLYENINSENKEIKIGDLAEKKEILINNNKNTNNKLNEMTIIYNIDKNKNKIRLFGSDFVKNNKNNCYILIDEQINELFDLYKLSHIQNKDILEIKLIETRTITDMSNIFNDCSSIISLSDISNWNTSKVTNMSYMFFNCKSLISLSDISNWNTSNVTNMCHMFSDCNSLISLPDISKWNTSKVTDIYF